MSKTCWFNNLQFSIRRAAFIKGDLVGSFVAKKAIPIFVRSLENNRYSITPTLRECQINKIGEGDFVDNPAVEGI